MSRKPNDFDKKAYAKSLRRIWGKGRFAALREAGRMAKMFKEIDDFWIKNTLRGTVAATEHVRNTFYFKSG